MIKVTDALKTILDSINIIDLETLKLTEALDRVLSEDIYAHSDIPAFDNSAMDGYALSSSDVAGANLQNPVFLDVIEDLPAGYIARREVKKGQAIRIMTGASIPHGADAVIMVEKTKKEGEQVKILESVKPGENIRPAGEDIKRGELVFKKGKIIGPAEMGVLASLGIKSIAVARAPRVGILATGEELVEVEENLIPGKIRNSNTYTLFGQVKNAGGIPYPLGIARDDKQDIKRKIEQGLDYDLLLISGGVSVGDYDYVKEVIAGLNGKIEFWKVAMRPGKPLVFGIIKSRPVFGLPGNPVSSMVSFEVFVRPTILKMLGQDDDTRKQVEAISEEEIKKKKGFRYFLRAQTHWKDGAYLTRTTGPQGSGILKSMALANSLIILPEEEEFIEKGTKVSVRFLH